MGKPLRRGARYYTRRRVPLDLVEAYDGRKEVVRALGTSDPTEGSRLNRLMWVELDEEFEARRAVAPAEAALPPVVPSPQEQEEQEAAAAVEGARQARYEARKQGRLLLRQRMHLSTAELTSEEAAARDLIREGKRDLDGLREANALLEARIAELSSGGAALSSPAKTRKGLPVPLPELIDRWAAERDTTQKTIKKSKAVVREVQKLHGPSPLTTADLTPQLVQSYKVALVGAGGSPATGNNKLGLFRALCRYARSNRLIEGDPCDGINIIVPKRRKAQDRRTAYDLPALSRIFASPVYTEGLRPSGGGGEAAYWLPLLALFTGARQRELGQLRVKDIAEETYQDGTGDDARAWVIKLVFDAADGVRLKNEGSERRIPVHPTLVTLGFLRFVAAARKAKASRLFPELRPDADGNPVAAWSKWYGRWQRKQCGVTDTRMVFHSFRHAFKHYARYSGIEREVHQEITGHESGDVGDSYGGLDYPLLPLVESIEKFRVPNFALPSVWTSPGAPS